MSKFFISLMMVVMLAAFVNADITYIQINDSAADGWSMNDGECVTNSSMSWTGYLTEGWSAVTQIYFTIPSWLKDPTIQIDSAELYVESGNRGLGNTGYGGTYVQLMQYNYDYGTVTVAQGEAIASGYYSEDHPENYTKIGGPSFKVWPPDDPSLEDWGRTWDVTAQLQGDIAANWTYMPFALKMTDSAGNWYASPYQVFGSPPPALNTFSGYYDSIWMLDANGDPTSRITPHITVNYTVIPEPATILLLGLSLAFARYRKA